MMAIATIVTRGFSGSIPLVVLRGFIPGASATPAETDSTAGLRYYARTLEMPEILLGSGRSVFEAEMAALVGVVSELGETITLAGTEVVGVGITPYLGALTAGTEVEGRTTAFYVSVADFENSGAGLGSAVTFRSVSYSVGRIERFDAPLVRLELVR